VNAQQKKVIVVVALLVMLVGVLIFQFARKAPGPPAIQNPPVTKAGGAPAPAGKVAAPAEAPKTQIKKTDINIDSLLAGIREVDFDYDKERMPRDPMAPLVGTLTKTRGGEEPGKEQPVAPATAVQVMSKVVSGIVWDAKRPIAVVDNEVVYPGYEYPDGTVVASIERNQVVFKVGDSLIQVPLKEL
jgi:hypothetical protein